MSVWEQYSQEQRDDYIKYLQVYGALSNLFQQKQGRLIPYLDSKFQETVFAKIFSSENVDIGNTPHDVLSILNGKRIGIGLKTWMNSGPSFQKVMQLKRYQNEIESCKHNLADLAYMISAIKNNRMKSDYERLGLTESNNIYHYITRDEGLFSIHECPYPLIQLDKIRILKGTSSSFSWTDGIKDYKFTYGDAQVWQNFDSEKYSTLTLDRFNIKIIEDPFSFLLKAYFDQIETVKEVHQDIVEVYLPLYSYKTGEVQNKSGLNAWNGSSKSKGSDVLRPLNEVYISIPIAFHHKYPNFFTQDILQVINARKNFKGNKSYRPEVRFHLQLPNGNKIPALVTQDNMKGLQSGSTTEIDPSTGKCFGQSALGQWLLVDVLGLKDRTLVTREWLAKKETDSVRLWRKKDEYSIINIDFAPLNAFEEFMDGHNTI